MAFYVPLGPRGVLLRIGTFVIGIWGGLVYRTGLPSPRLWPAQPSALDHPPARLIRIRISQMARSQPEPAGPIRAAVWACSASLMTAEDVGAPAVFSRQTASGNRGFIMCGIAGAFDLKGTREFPLAAAPGDDRGDRPSRSRRRAVPHRAGRGAGGPAAVDHRPGGGPAADQQRGRIDLGRLQRRAVRVSRAAPRAAGPRASPGDAMRHRGVGPSLRGPRRGDVRQGPGPVRRLALGPATRGR